MSESLLGRTFESVTRDSWGWKAFREIRKFGQRERPLNSTYVNALIIALSWE